MKILLISLIFIITAIVNYSFGIKDGKEQGFKQHCELCRKCKRGVNEETQKIPN